MPETIGFIGLGQMGEPIATNLLAAGHALKVYNRTASKADALKAKGATVVGSLADVATPGGFVFTMVADDRALDSLISAKPSFIEKLGNGGIHVSMSTIAPSTAKRLADEHRKFGVEYVGSPVFGRPEAAASKMMWTCLSGVPAAKQRVRPLLDAIGRGGFDLGDEPSAANVVKICGNFLIASAVEAMAEAFTLAEKNGVDPNVAYSLLTQTLFAAPIYQLYGKFIIDGKFEPARFSMTLGLKDVNLALQAAGLNDMPMPLASLLRDRFLTSLAKGRKDFDWVGIALDVAEDAGLKKAAVK